ncbi:hypothetical protein [Caudoviricetes sp.]|nr:hypothetical protein [Caudoviricetes sp.]
MGVEKVELNVMVAKEIHEVGVALESLIKNYKLAAADGFQAAQDLPAVLLGSINDLMKAMEGANKVGDEFKEELSASLKGALIPILNGLELLIKK